MGHRLRIHPSGAGPTETTNGRREEPVEPGRLSHRKGEVQHAVPSRVQDKSAPRQLSTKAKVALHGYMVDRHGSGHQCHSIDSYVELLWVATQQVEKIDGQPT